MAQVVAAFQVGPEFNVIKFRTDELKISFLSYPRFFDDPHPALRHAITIDLVRGKARHTDYADNPNPPILHRKEAFLPAEHPDLGYSLLNRAVLRSNFAGRRCRRRQTMLMGRLPSWLM